MNSFISYTCKGVPGTGVISGGKTYALPYKDMRECIASGFDTTRKKDINTGGIKLLSPILPSKIVCLGWNYAKHVKERKPAGGGPIIFLKPSTSVIGPDDSIILPKISKQVEHEIELGIVVGKKGKDISLDKADEYIAGYTIILDMTARDLQAEARKKGDPWDVCKGFDTFAPIGPGIVPKKYVPDAGRLALELKVNGKPRQKSNTSEMLMKPPEIVSYVSEYMTLEAGDVIASGTPEGVGLVKDGDVIESTIEKIGYMRNYAINE